MSIHINPSSELVEFIEKYSVANIPKRYTILTMIQYCKNNESQFRSAFLKNLNDDLEALDN